MEKRHINKWVEITGQIPSFFLTRNSFQKNRTFVQKKKKKGEGEKEERDDLRAKKKLEGFLEVSFWSWGIFYEHH